MLTSNGRGAENGKKVVVVMMIVVMLVGC